MAITSRSRSATVSYWETCRAFVEGQHARFVIVFDTPRTAPTTSAPAETKFPDRQPGLHLVRTRLSPARMSAQSGRESSVAKWFGAVTAYLLFAWGGVASPWQGHFSTEGDGYGDVDADPRTRGIGSQLVGLRRPRAAFFH